MRELVVIIVVVAKRRQIRGNLWVCESLFIKGWMEGTYIKRHADPARLLVALKKIWRTGPADEETTPSTSGPATNRRTMRKTKPVESPTRTVYTMILGPSFEGFGISSII